MPIKKQLQAHLSHPKTYSLLLAGGWSLVIIISLVASISVHQQETVTIAQNVARAYIDKDILYRNWNAFHGGIYVATDKGVVPNPFYPSSLEERDVTTPSGRHLTLVNPAYMSRQIYEFAQNEQKGSR